MCARRAAATVREAMKDKASIASRLAGESRTPEEIREAVYLFEGDVGAKQSRFWLLLVLAAGDRHGRDHLPTPPRR